jgi:hypothetical protein
LEALIMPTTPPHVNMENDIERQTKLCGETHYTVLEWDSSALAIFKSSVARF